MAINKALIPPSTRLRVPTDASRSHADSTFKITICDLKIWAMAAATLRPRLPATKLAALETKYDAQFERYQYDTIE